MENNQVRVVYSEYGSTPVIKEIELELVKDTTLKLACDMEGRQLCISMADSITENTEISGKLDCDKLNALIRALAQIRNQLK